MPTEKSAVDPLSFTNFGTLLCYLRRREQLTQRDLGIAVGYSEGHINRFEKNKRIPPPAVVAALFVPALGLAYDSNFAARLMELAAATHPNPAEAEPEIGPQPEIGLALESIPPAPPNEVPRGQVYAEVEARLAAERRVVLSGLPGMGKTTIASQVARLYARKMAVFWLTLTEGITASADVLIRQLAAFLAARGQSAVNPLVIIPSGPPAPIPLDLKLALICQALVKLPVLLCFDNAELICDDETSLRVLRHISVTTPALILMISRESLPLPAFAGIGMDGFEAEEGRAFISHHSGAKIDHKQIERLLAKTDGSPMLLRLALGTLRAASGQAEAEQFISHLETQPQVMAYLFETIQKQLSPGGWRLLLLLAAFQQPVNLYDPHLLELANTVGEIEAIPAAIAELQRRQLILNAAYAQLHPLVGSYASLALNTEVNLRQRMHRLAADWFRETGQDALRAALHYNQAGLLEQAVDTIEENHTAIVGHGQALAAVAVLDEVQTKLQRQRSSPGDLLRRLLIGRGMLLAGTLRVAEGEANLRQAIALTTTPAVRAYTQFRLAELRMYRSDFQETLQLIQAARSELTPQDVLLQARLTGLEAIVHGAAGMVAESTRCANETLALADQLAGIPDNLIGEIQARAQMELANCARIQRNIPAAMEYARAALQSGRRSQNLRTANLSLSFTGGMYYDLGDLEASFRYRMEGMEGLLAIGDVHSAAYSLTQLADIHYVYLEMDQAFEKLDRARETLLAVSDMRGLAACESLRTTCLLWNNQMEEARQVILHLLEVAKGKGTERLWGYRLNKLAMIQLVSGQTAAGMDTLQEALDLPASAANPMLRFDLLTKRALGHAAAGDPESAIRSLAEAPRREGLSRWVEFERELIEGFVALGRGAEPAAREILNRLWPRVEPYPLYRQNARQLEGAIQRCAAPADFPRLLWVQEK